MIWTNAQTDLRTLLSDGPEDKLRYRKRVFGEINGNNTRFKTLEFRRVSNFTEVDAPLGVWLSGELLSSSDISDDNPTTGDFEMSSAPDDGQVLEASYYVQWFLDSEIESFLRLSSNWLALGDNFLNIAEGLRPAALKYAAAEAYQKLSLRWAEHLAETFLLNDAPDEKRFSIVEAYRKQALDYRKEAERVRDDFYSRSGQQKQPLWGNNVGPVSDPTPQR